MKKRVIFVTEEEYLKAGKVLKESGIKWWNETETFFFHKITAGIMVLGFIVVLVIVGALNM